MTSVLKPIKNRSLRNLLPVRGVLVLASLGISTACVSSSEYVRDPAGQSTSATKVAARACQSMSDSDVKSFQTFVLSSEKIAFYFDVFAEIAKVAQIQMPTRTKQLGLDAFYSSENGILFGEVERFSKMLLNECILFREGDLNLSKKDSAKFKTLCGLPDRQIPQKDRTHPYDLREWVNPDADDTKAKIHEWVYITNHLRNWRNGDMASPSKALEFCTNYREPKSIEDTIEGLFICLDAFTYNFYEFNESTGRYEYEDSIPKIKSSTKPLEACVQGYLKGVVQTTNDGRPHGYNVGAAQFPSNSEIVERGWLGLRAAATPANSSISTQTSPPQKANAPLVGVSGDASKVYVNDPSIGLPGDAQVSASRSKPQDSCTAEFLYNAKQTHTAIPSAFSTKDLNQIYDNEKHDYAVEIARRQLGNLLNMHVSTSFVRRWSSDADYNQNLDDFAASCTFKPLRSELFSALESLYYGPKSEPSLATFLMDKNDEESDQYKGRQMAIVVAQIQKLKEISQLLSFDLGASVIDTFKYPHEMGNVNMAHLLPPLAAIPSIKKWARDNGFEIPVPFLNYFSDREAGINFNSHAKFQCNMFNSLGSVWVNRDASLITEADKIIANKMKDERLVRAMFRLPHKTFFPERDIPAPLRAYLEITNPSGKGISFVSGDNKVRLYDWCQMRSLAAVSVVQRITQLASYYPVLMVAMRDPNDPTKLLPTIADIIERDLKTKPFAEVVRTAADMAEQYSRTEMKKRLLSAVAGICGALEKKQYDITMHSILSGSLTNDFNYCRGVSGSSESPQKNSLTCGQRADYISCRLRKEARQWDASKKIVPMFKDLGLVAFDALGVFTLGATNLAGITVGKALFGGAVAVGFSAAELKFSQYLYSKNEEPFEDLNLSAVLANPVSLDGYAETMGTILATEPRWNWDHAVSAFILGAALAGGGDEAGAMPKNEYWKTSPKNNALRKVQFWKNPPKNLAEFSKRLKSLAEEHLETGAKLDPKKLAEFDEWLRGQAHEDPLFDQALRRGMRKSLEQMSDTKMRKLLKSSGGDFLKGRLLRVTFSDFKIVVEKLRTSLAQSNSDAGILKIADQLPELLKDADPRSVATVTRAIDDALTKAAKSETPKKIYEQLSRNICSLMFWCADLRTLKGCGI